MSHSHQRDVLFLSLSGIFLTALVLGNVIGTTKFVTIFSFSLPEWVQSFTPSLVRDGSLYTMSVPAGRKKAQLVVWVGFFMNFFMLLLMKISYSLPNTFGVSGGLDLFEGVYEFMVGNTIASMIAYLTAQSVDVRLFHFWKKKTKGRHLWLRNNASTMFSQLVDSTAIILILFFTNNLGANITTIGAVLILILNSYLFKFFFALFDTPLFYLGVKLFQKYEEDPERNSLY